MGKKCPKCGGITYFGFLCPNCGRINGSNSSLEKEKEEEEKEEKLKELQIDIEKLMLEHEKFMEVCDTLPKCIIENSCESCEVYEKLSIIEKQIEENETKIEELEGEIPLNELAEIPEENIDEKLKQNDFRYLFENELMQYIDKEKLKPHFRAFLDYLYEEEENRDSHQDRKDIFEHFNGDIDSETLDKIEYEDRICRITEKIREYFGEEEIKIFIEYEKKHFD